MTLPNPSTTHHFSAPNLDELVKSRTDTILVIPAPDPVRGKLQPESSLFEGLKTPGPAPDSDPGFAGVTSFRTFYETVNLKPEKPR